MFNNKWSQLMKMIKKSPNKIQVQNSNKDNSSTLVSLGVNGESTLGKILLKTSEIKVNNYLRILGGDDLVFFNNIVKKYHGGNKLVIANDIWGGWFAIGNGDFEDDPRCIWYYAPDMLRWENLQIGYSKFIEFACSKDIEEFYQSFMWYGMEEMLNTVTSQQCILIYPFLWAQECDITTASKKIVSIEELMGTNFQYQQMLDNK